MKSIRTRHLCLLIAALLLAPLAAAKDETTTLRIVVQDEEGKPVPRAGLIIRTLKGKNKDKVDQSMELRVSQEGVAPVPPLKRGFVLIQVIAKDFQTFGERYELKDQEQTITITLKPPQDQFSVHKKRQ